MARLVNRTASGPWSAAVMDRLENKLHQLVCHGTSSLDEARHKISTNWIDAYKTHVNPMVGLSHRPHPGATSKPGGAL